MTEWPEDRKNRCLSVSTNSAGLHLRERVQKIKKKTAKKKKKNEKKMKKIQKGPEEYGGKKTRLLDSWAIESEPIRARGIIVK